MQEASDRPPLGQARAQLTFLTVPGLETGHNVEAILMSLPPEAALP